MEDFDNVSSTNTELLQGHDLDIAIRALLYNAPVDVNI